MDITEFAGHIELGMVTGGPQQGRGIDRRHLSAKALSEAGARALEALKPPACGDHRGIGILRVLVRSELPRLAEALRREVA